MYIVNTKNQYINTFKKHICSACRLCDTDIPAFCMTIYGGNPERFFEIITYIKVLQTRGREAVDDMCTFNGFCGLFCNSKKQCPKKSPKCKELSSVFACWTSFVNQFGEHIPTYVKADIWKSFSGIEMSTLGELYRLPTKSVLKTVEKKKRKKIKKIIRKAKVGMRLGTQSYNHLQVKTKKKKPVKTTFFCNDDEEWKNKINSYLESKEN